VPDRCRVAAWAMLISSAVMAPYASAAAPVSASVGSPVSGSAASDTASKAVCNRMPTAARSLDRLGQVMLQGRFVAYQPTSLQIFDGHPTHADPAGIRADLQVLRPRFDGLITYGSVDGAEAIPAVAASLGFRAVIIGVRDPFEPSQLDAAIGTARAYPDIVTGISLGNELVFTRRHSFADLAALAVRVRRRLPAIAISTTEPFHMFYFAEASELLRQLDFMLVNVHPVFQPWFRRAPDHNAAEFVVNVVTKLSEVYCGSILVKEVGVPTAPSEAGFTPERQASFFTELVTQFPPSRERSFAYFSAFDAPWRAFDEIADPARTSSAATHPEEAHWGLFDERRRPKPAVARVPMLAGAPR
jgi:exo-beta-1,3-glucanase (GH17 family)